MTNQDDVRRIALSLPGTREGTERFALSVENKGKQKGFPATARKAIKPARPARTG